MIKTKILNKNFKVDDIVLCTNGSWKGELFKIEVVLKNNNGYSCSMLEHNGKYYEMNDNCLVAFKQFN